MKKSWVAALVLTVMLVCPVLASDTEYDRATLAGLSGVHVLVENTTVERKEEWLSRATLQTDVELRLRQNGIRVLTREAQLTTPGSPFLYVRAVSMPDGFGGFVVCIELILSQGVVLERNPSIASTADTWSATSVMGRIGPNSKFKVRETVRDQVDQFVNAYLAANPKR